MKNEHLGLSVLLRHLFRGGESLFVRSVLFAAGVVIEVVAVAVDNAYDYIVERESTLDCRQRLKRDGRSKAAGAEETRERHATVPSKNMEYMSAALAKKQTRTA
jgi:hypothetical protein